MGQIEPTFRDFTVEGQWTQETEHRRAERAKARLIVADRSQTVEDCRFLLNVLGLMGEPA